VCDKTTIQWTDGCLILTIWIVRGLYVMNSNITFSRSNCRDCLLVLHIQLIDGRFLLVGSCQQNHWMWILAFCWCY